MQSIEAFPLLILQAQEMLEEYLTSGDVGEVARQLQETGCSHFGWAVVKKAITLAMDRHDREREMTSVLLSSLYGEVRYRHRHRPTPSPSNFHAWGCVPLTAPRAEAHAFQPFSMNGPLPAVPDLPSKTGVLSNVRL